MDEIISTLKGQDDALNYGRRSGCTTRLVDNAIQLLFSGATVQVEDHHLMGRHTRSNRYLLSKIMDRLRLEHAGIFMLGELSVVESYEGDGHNIIRIKLPPEAITQQ